MTSINELLELDSKQTIFGTDTEINTFGGWGSDNKAFIKASPDMAVKLREIVEMLPEIKARMQNGTCGIDDDKELNDKLEKWENS